MLNHCERRRRTPLVELEPSEQGDDGSIAGSEHSSIHEIGASRLGIPHPQKDPSPQEEPFRRVTVLLQAIRQLAVTLARRGTGTPDQRKKSCDGVSSGSGRQVPM